MNLGENDIRAMVRLVGGVATIPGGHARKKSFLMQGLCQLIDADSWAWALSCQREPDKPQVYVSFVKDGFTEETFVKFLEAVEHPDMIKIASRFFLELKERNTHLTRSRHEIAEAHVIDQSQAVEVWKAANVGPTIISMRPLDATSSSMTGLYRHYGKPEFTPREIRIAHIVLTEVPWLHEQGWPEDRGVNIPKLSKRQRLTLNLLTFGQSHKQIASNMGISVHTAKDYIKDVYRIFQVRSQAELMNRFLRGDGGDKAS